MARQVVNGRGGRVTRPPFAWLAAAAALGVVLAVLFPDSYQQDGGTHYLGARWAWDHPWLLVDVWGRPLFTLLYSLPAPLGYLPAKLTTVAIATVVAWQTWRLAHDRGVERAGLVVPLLFLQPAFLLLSHETMTEPLFALVFVVALRLHRAGRVRAGMLVASTMVLARPEGFFLALLWGVWVLLDRRDPRVGWRRLPSTLWLATGAAAWWAAAWAITSDPLFIAHNWPTQWATANYGHGSLLTYWDQRSIIAGRLLYVPFLVGLAVSLARRTMLEEASAFLFLFALHSSFWAFGLFGSAGYARYFVCVAPATALITLSGWNAIVRRLEGLPVPAASATGRVVAAVLLLYSALSALSYVDSLPWSRDAGAVDRAVAWFRGHPRPVRSLVVSQALMCIRFDCDPTSGPVRLRYGDSARTLAQLRAAPPGTLVFWDGNTGPAWYNLRARDVVAAGYVELYASREALRGRFPFHLWRPFVDVYPQEMHLLYKPSNGESGATGN